MCLYMTVERLCLGLVDHFYDRQRLGAGRWVGPRSAYQPRCRLIFAALVVKQAERESI